MTMSSTSFMNLSDSALKMEPPLLLSNWNSSVPSLDDVARICGAAPV